MPFPVLNHIILSKVSRVKMIFYILVNIFNEKFFRNKLIILWESSKRLSSKYSVPNLLTHSEYEYGYLKMNSFYLLLSLDFFYSQLFSFGHFFPSLRVSIFHFHLSAWTRKGMHSFLSFLAINIENSY